MGSVPSKSSSNYTKNDTTVSLMQENIENPQPSPEMPRKLSKKQSPEAKKRFQHQMYLAKESPELIFDISGCELSEIPSTVYSLCKVLQKEVLDVHHNDIQTISGEIGEIDCLKVLNIENNKVKVIPEAIGKLELLQDLNIRGNKVTSIPTSMRKLQNLQRLDISMNNISVLPEELCQLTSLEELILDSENMKYPPAEICMQGTESVMRFLCNKCGTEYHPPTKNDTNKLSKTAEMNFNPGKLKAEVSAISETLAQYEIVRERKKHEHAYLEKQLEEEQRARAELVANSNRNKQQILQQVAQQQDQIHNDIMSAQYKKESERRKLIKTLEDEERNASRLVEDILSMNEKAGKTEALLEAMEQERIEAEQLFVVRKEEIDLLRQKEVLTAMKYILQETEMFDEIIRKHLSSREESARRSIKVVDETDGKVNSVLQMKHAEKLVMAEKLLHEETLQKEAFEALLMQRDAKHQRLSGQIEAIEAELSSLSMLEIEQKEMRMDTQRNILTEKRHALASLLVQLMREKQVREVELRKRLMEMEKQRMDDQTDYWLVQYQRLMDRKPQALINQEHQLEQVVIDILDRAGAMEYLPQFARRKISIETLCQMKIDDFKLMGVRDGVRNRILAEVDLYKKSKASKYKDKMGDVQKPQPDKPWKEAKKERETTDDYQTEEPKHEPTAPPDEIIGRMAPECVVCMNNDCEVIFLTCGHVCCCVPCAEPLRQCPMCRADIQQRIRLSRD